MSSKPDPGSPVAGGHGRHAEVSHRRRGGVVGRSLGSTVAVMLALILLSVGGSIYYAFTMPEQYTGRALVQFRPRATVNGGVVSNETTASAAAGYAAYLGAPSTLRAVAALVGVSPLDLKDNMSVELVPATTSLSVTFADGNPAVAARGASALARIGAERAADDPLVSAAVLAPASVPDLPSTPSKKVVLAAGGVLGLLLAVIACVVMSARRSTRGARTVYRTAADAASDPEEAAAVGGRRPAAEAPGASTSVLPAR